MWTKNGIRGIALLLVAWPGVLAAQPPSAASLIQQARGLAAASQLQQANEALAESLRQEPQNLTAWQSLGEVQLAQMLYSDAMTSFENVLKREPSSTPAQEGEVRAAVADSLASRNAGDQDGALRCLLRARKYVPRSAELLMDFGIQADRMQIYRDADEALTEAHTLAPADATVLYALAHVEVDEQKTREAESNLRAYVKIRPDDASAHYGLGHLLSMLSKYDEARRELELSISLQPRQTESYYELGQVALNLQDDAAAKADYTRVLASAPNHGGALTGMGILAYRAKDFMAADRYLAQGVLYAPDFVTAHRYYAMTLARLGRQEQSQREAAVAEELAARQDKLSRGYALTTAPATHP
jgi:tetratricopeptide (TPR) repeat protein